MKTKSITLAILAVAILAAASVGGAMIISNESNVQDAEGRAIENEAQLGAELAMASLATKMTSNYTPEVVINDVDPETLEVLSANDFYDVTDHVYVGSASEAQRRIDLGHNVIQLPVHSSEYVFFMDTGDKAGDTWAKAIMVAEGKKVIASVQTEVFFPYSTAPDSFWTIQDGHFVKLHPESDITLLNNLYSELSAKQCELAETEMMFQMYVDGVLTEEQYAPTKAIRVQLYSDIYLIKAQIAELLA